MLKDKLVKTALITHKYSHQQVFDGHKNQCTVLRHTKKHIFS